MPNKSQIQILNDPKFVIWDLEFPALNCHKFNGETLQTVRQQIIELLTDGEMDVRQLSREVGIKEKEVYEHLTHISRSLAARRRKINIRPSECLKCGYVFEDRKRFTRPGRCPRCRESHIINPSFKIT